MGKVRNQTQLMALLWQTDSTLVTVRFGDHSVEHYGLVWVAPLTDLIQASWMPHPHFHNWKWSLHSSYKCYCYCDVQTNQTPYGSLSSIPLPSLPPHLDSHQLNPPTLGIWVTQMGWHWYHSHSLLLTLIRMILSQYHSSLSLLQFQDAAGHWFWVWRLKYTWLLVNMSNPEWQVKQHSPILNSSPMRYSSQACSSYWQEYHY